MNMQQILSAVKAFFPSKQIDAAITEAQNRIGGVKDTVQDVQRAAQQMGIDQGTIDDIYNKIGRTQQARMICSMLGTTPEAIKADADALISGNPGKKTTANAVKSTGASKKFPRLK